MYFYKHEILKYTGHQHFRLVYLRDHSSRIHTKKEKSNPFASSLMYLAVYLGNLLEVWTRPWLHPHHH